MTLTSRKIVVCVTEMPRFLGKRLKIPDRTWTARIGPGFLTDELIVRGGQELPPCVAGQLFPEFADVYYYHDLTETHRFWDYVSD